MMFEKLRVRTFARFIAAYGEEALMECLERNEQNGIVYHYSGQLIGDYDRPGSEEEIRRLILFGK
jgi:hypothetical protein